MSPLESIFKKEYAFELLRIAEEDLNSAKILHDSGQARAENVLFHVEQAIEKSLKAVLCFNGKAVPLVHDLLAILQKFDSQDLPPGGYSLHDLTPFATIRRYEEGKAEIGNQDIDLAMQAAKKVMQWAKEKINVK